MVVSYLLQLGLNAEIKRKLGDKFAGNNLYDNPPCFDEVIYVSLPKEEEIMYRYSRPPRYCSPI